MTSWLRLWLGTLLLVLLVGGAWWWRMADPTTPPLLPAGPVPTAATPAPLATAATTPTPTLPAERTLAPTARTEDSPLPRLPQGFRGRVVDAQGQPVAAVEVHLLESAGNEPLTLPLLQREAFGPLVTRATDADGHFEVGLPVAQDKLYDVVVVSAVHAVARLGGLRLLADAWHDLGTIALVAGATVRGRVTVAGRPETPVPRAMVTLTAGTAFADAALRALPGTPPGLTTLADTQGYYELHHAPRRGAVRLTAVAPGFARALRHDVELQTAAPVVVDFELPPGLTLAGTVVDADQQPIAGARLEVWQHRAAKDPLTATTDPQGRFVVAGLAEAPHRLRVQARGFAPYDLAEVAAGRQDLRCQLQPRNRIRVRAVSPTGEVLRSYRLAVRRWFPDTPEKLGLCAEAAELRVRLDGMTDFAELPDAPEGWLVCEVEAPEFATTWSAPIDNRLLAAGGASTPPANAGGRVHQVEVRVQRGASLRGIVLDAAGAPLAGAELRTFAADAMPDNPLFQLLAGARPERTTTATATTNTNGAFRFDRLAPGAYQLRVEHPEACRSTVRDVVLAEATDQLLPPLRLPRGCQVQGRATVAGRVAGQLKVVLTTTTTTTDEALRLETVTDSDGRFRLPRRIPPGNYELRAAVVGTAEPEAQIFQQILQLQRSATTLVVAPGQTVAECSLDLPSDR